jgi:uncharacterized protein YndB with AHSA1/START domain
MRKMLAKAWLAMVPKNAAQGEEISFYRMQLRRFSKVLVVAGVALILFAPLPVEIRSRIFKAIDIDRPPQSVFDYVTTARNWPVWHPSSLAVSGETERSAAPGARIAEQFVVAGFHGKVMWTVTERVVPRRWVIEATLANGGGGRITYTLSAAGQGTRFEREFVYWAPNLFSVILDRCYVRERIAAESTEALRRLKVALES